MVQAFALDIEVFAESVGQVNTGLADINNNQKRKEFYNHETVRLMLFGIMASGCLSQIWSKF